MAACRAHAVCLNGSCDLVDSSSDLVMWIILVVLAILLLIVIALIIHLALKKKMRYLVKDGNVSYIDIGNKDRKLSAFDKKMGASAEHNSYQGGHYGNEFDKNVIDVYDLSNDMRDYNDGEDELDLRLAQRSVSDVTESDVQALVSKSPKQTPHDSEHRKRSSKQKSTRHKAEQVSIAGSNWELSTGFDQNDAPYDTDDATLVYNDPSPHAHKPDRQTESKEKMKPKPARRKTKQTSSQNERKPADNYIDPVIVNDIINNGNNGYTNQSFEDAISIPMKETVSMNPRSERQRPEKPKRLKHSSHDHQNAKLAKQESNASRKRRTKRRSVDLNTDLAQSFAGFGEFDEINGSLV